MYEWELYRARPLQFLTQIYAAAAPSSKIYFVHGSFGDVYKQLAVIGEAIENGSVTTILIDKKYEKLASLVSGSKSVILFVDSLHAQTIFNGLGILGNVGSHPIRLLPTVYPMMAECMSEGILQYGDFLRLIVGSKVIGRFHSLEKIDKLKKDAVLLMEQIDAPIGRSVLISADNNTHMEFSERFWSDICDYINYEGWTPLINNSGTLTSEHGKILTNSKWPKIKIPPHLCVTIPAIAGCYIGGTNGFSTVQALFQESVAGLHLINGLKQEGIYLRDKSGNLIKLEQIPHKNTFRKEFLGLQTEILLDNETIDESLKKIIFQSISRNVKL